MRGLTTAVVALCLAVSGTAVLLGGGGCGGTSSARMGTGDIPSAGPRLTLRLSTKLDNIAGTVKCTAITQAELLDTTGAVVKTATIAASAAKFDLTGVAAGDYFIRVNSDATDLVPTRLVTAGVSVNQFAGQKLRRTVIGGLAAPTLRFDTFSQGQAQHPAVAYSTGVGLDPTRYAYVVERLSPSPQKIEIRVLGTAAPLTSYTASGAHDFADFMLGARNHGVHASQRSCGGCHGTLTSKTPKYRSIKEDNGFCYKCHYGPSGPSLGMLDPTK